MCVDAWTGDKLKAGDCFVIDDGVYGTVISEGVSAYEVELNCNMAKVFGMLSRPLKLSRISRDEYTAGVL